MAAVQRIDVAEAAALIGQHVPAFPDDCVPLADAVGAVLREALHAERDQPPFDRVTMDGVAIRHAAFAAGRGRYRVVGTQGAGAGALAVGSDDACVEIMTGAMLPADADTVIPVERLHREGDSVVLEPGYVPTPGQFVHRRGSDHKAGTRLLAPGMRIGPTEAAVLTLGASAEVRVARWPRIAVISTGDELVAPGEPIQPYQVRSSNDQALAAALRLRGFPHITRARLPDDPGELQAAIGRLHEAHDVLIPSGGVSMGQFDYLPRVLDELGVQVVFHKVLQRPGLPMWFGVSAAGKPVFALPGNPVSSLVCLVRYVLPALQDALGLRAAPPPAVRLAETVGFTPDLTWFLPVALQHTADGAVAAVPRPTNTSGDFAGLVGTDGFLELPRGRDEFPAGYAARFHAW